MKKLDQFLKMHQFRFSISFKRFYFVSERDARAHHDMRTAKIMRAFFYGAPAGIMQIYTTSDYIN